MVRLPISVAPVRILLATFSALLLLANFAFAEAEFPYIAYVSEDGAYVRSGPGQRHYPTGQVEQGFAVEVYRHDGSNWCAIRPTKDSFSWVAAHEVRMLNEQLAEVVAEQSVARVGSLLSPTRSAVQVMLPLGERVAVLPAGQNDDPRWVRIVAPAGEFRWIAAEHLSRRPPMEIAPPTPATTGWKQSQPATANETVAIKEPASAFGHLESTSSDTSLTNNSLHYTAPPQAVANPIGDIHTMEVIAGSPAEMQLAQYQAPNPGLAPLPPNAQAIPTSPTSQVTNSNTPRVRLPSATTSPGKKSANVAELELLVSQVVAQPPAQWELSSIQTEAKLQLENAKSTTERVQLRDLLSRLDRFQQVQQEYKQSTATPLQPFASTPTLPQVAPASNIEEDYPLDAAPEDPLARVVANVRERVQEDLRSGSQADDEESRYDAVGRLKPVVSKREKAPPFALVDDQGEVVSFVTPTPDLNLQPFVGRKIGVSGNRGFMPEYRRAHVTAGRVVPVIGTVRR